MPHVLLIQPDELCPPALIYDSLASKEIATTTAMLHAGAPLPKETGGFDGVVLLGGPQSAIDAGQRPLVDGCGDIVRAFHTSGRPVLGICLGAQLVSAALGGTVWRLDQLQFGLCELIKTPEAQGDPVLKDMQQRQRAFLWHEDGFTLPPGGEHLISREGHEAYGFRHGPLTYGFQCHLEVTADGVRRMLERGSNFVTKHLGVEGERLLASIEDEMAEHMPSATAFGTRVSDAWCDLVIHKSGLRTTTT